MNWFTPTSETIAFVAESCLALAFIIYVLLLPNKTKDHYVLTLASLAYFLFMFITVFDTSIAFSTYFLQLLHGFSLYFLALCWLLWFAFQFPVNFYRAESAVVTVVGLLLMIFPLSQTRPDTFTLFSLVYSIVCNIYGIVVLVRKHRKVDLLLRTTNAGGVNLKKQKQLIRIIALTFIFNLSLQGFLFLLIAQLVPVIIYIIFQHFVFLTNFIIISYSFLTYTQSPTSFIAKLTGVILYVMLTVLVMLPILIFGNGGLRQGESGHYIYSPLLLSYRSILLSFIIAVPITVLAVIVVLPLLFKKVILQPLNAILKGVQKVNGGDLSAGMEMVQNDEIGVLSGNFNQMTSSLRLYSEKMNDLVEKRTAALNQSLKDLKSTQAQLIQSEKMASLGELTAGIAHEIQNPLNFVNNFSEVSNELVDEMKEELATGNLQVATEIADDIKQNLQKINHHGKRADAIVKGMLQHSRTNTGKAEPTDINKLCDEYLRLSYHGLRAKDKNFNADFKTDFDESVGKINIVPQDIGRVLLNLFNNAFYAVNERQKAESIKANVEYKPLVSVRTRRLNSPSGDGGVEIIVSDNGNGIPQHIIDKIFQPFFTTKPTGQGTGLGLSLSYDIIKAHGGKIKVETKQEAGTAFIISFPLTF